MKKEVLLLLFVMFLAASAFAQDTLSAHADTATKKAPSQQSLDEVTIISSNRTLQRMEDAPTKVEVLGPEEVNEENSIKPGNVASLLGDVSGIQIQQSSAVNGASNVRIQGLEGRYTQLLRDGMPLFEGMSGSFGILQIPPLDLRQIEIIKGSASTLYGGGAIGGLINFISRRPKTSQEATVTINGSSLHEKNLNAYVAKRGKKAGYNVFAGFTDQAIQDVDGDGFSDVPFTLSVLVHPRFFFYPDEHTTIIVGYSGSVEQRRGGDIEVVNGSSDSLHRFYEYDDMQRHTAELIAERTMRHNWRATLKGTYSRFSKELKQPDLDFAGVQENYYSEASLLIPSDRIDIVGGINLTGDAFHKQSPDYIPLTDFSNNVIGAFGQATLKLKGGSSVEGGMRVDHHDRFGFFFLPRIAALYRINSHWALRGGYGAGYRAPNVLAPQTVEIPPDQVLPLSNRVEPERSYGLNLEVNYLKEWDADRSFFINQAFFLTRIDQPVTASNAIGTYFFSNEKDPVETRGSDTYVRARIKHWELYVGYTFTDAVRYYVPNNSPFQSQFMPLMPRNRTAATLVWEPTELWRIGLEASYNGRQYRDLDSKTPDYLFLATSIMRGFGRHWQLVLNGENLLDYRQSRVEQLYYGSHAQPTFRPLWAPIDGRVINISLKWTL